VLQCWDFESFVAEQLAPALRALPDAASKISARIGLAVKTLAAFATPAFWSTFFERDLLDDLELISGRGPATHLRTYLSGHRSRFGADAEALKRDVDALRHALCPEFESQDESARRQNAQRGFRRTVEAFRLGFRVLELQPAADPHWVWVRMEGHIGTPAQVARRSIALRHTPNGWVLTAGFARLLATLPAEWRTEGRRPGLLSTKDNLCTVVGVFAGTLGLDPNPLDLRLLGVY
jgi:hypothetical protein